VNTHKNARLTPAGRAVLVRRVLVDRISIREVARGMGISERTAKKWLARYRAGGEPALRDRSSRPKRSPRALRRATRRQIMRLRRQRRSSLYIAHSLRLPVSTVVTVQRRLGLNRLPRLEPPQPVVRYERLQPGELVHLDVKKLVRIGRVGHRIHGDRTTRVRGIGWEFLHVAIDDHSRATYAELRPDEGPVTAVRFVERAAAWFRRQGIRRIERVMTDNGNAYRSHVFRRHLAELGARQLYTRPYTPRTNGKAERVIQTLLREWAYAQPYRTSLHRSLALRPYLAYYNTHRPHTALNFRPPVSRLAQ
jgi:transposase InsO family protein